MKSYASKKAGQAPSQPHASTIQQTSKMRAQIEYNRKKYESKDKLNKQVYSIPEYLKDVESKIKNQVEYHKKLSQDHKREKSRSINYQSGSEK